MRASVAGRCKPTLNYTRSRRLESRLMSVQPVTSPSTAERLDLHDVQQLEDVGFMTCMTLVLLGNYAQTGHFGGPLAYTPYNVATHLVGPERAGCTSTIGVRSTRTATNSCSPRATAFRPATRCG